MSSSLKAAIVTSCMLAAGQPAVAQGIGDDAQLRVYLWNGHLGYALLAGLIMLLLFAVVVGLMAWVVCRIMNGRPDGAETGGKLRLSPRQILDERFARGDIDQAEFEDRKKSLGV